jgi:hypothetical protein
MSDDYKLKSPRLKPLRQHQVFSLIVELMVDETVDVVDVVEKPDLENAPSMVLMQYLTKRCLDFEVKFGKYPGRYG